MAADAHGNGKHVTQANGAGGPVQDLQAWGQLLDMALNIDPHRITASDALLLLDCLQTYKHSLGEIARIIDERSAVVVAELDRRAGQAQL